MEYVYKHMDWSNVEVLGRNRLPVRPFYCGYPNKESARQGRREECSNYRLLNGQWKFAYYESPFYVPDTCMEKEYDDREFGMMPVPGHWQLNGYDYPHYNDAIALFPILDDPGIQADNPTGVYRYTFQEEKQKDREYILRFAGASAVTLPYAEDYLSVYLLGTLFVEISTGLNTFINSQGRPNIAMYSVLIGALLNIVLDPIFIFWFDMGVKGAALATILSQACSAWWVLGFLCSDRASLRLQKCYLKFDRRIVGRMLALGVSPFIMASTESLVGFVLNGSLEKFGDIYVGALAILQSAMQLVSVPLTGFAQGFVPVASYNYGHGDRQRVKDCFRIVLTVMFSFNFVLMLLMICFPTVVASAFTSDPELIATVEHVLPLFLAGMTIFGLQRACQNMFVALGQARISIFMALLRKVILLVPLALVLPHFCGVEGVFMAEAVSDATAAICCTLLFFWQFPKILRKMQNLVQN